MGPRLQFSTGGSLEANAHAQVDAWEKSIAFLSS